jgi:malonyl-CoA decarboxylase
LNPRLEPLAGARRVISQCRHLLSERGEVSGTRRADEVLRAYQALDRPALVNFLSLLATEFSPPAAEVRRSADAYCSEPSAANLTRLQAAVESPRQELFRRLNMARGGMQALIEMRRHVLLGVREHPEWVALDADLSHLFRSWFNRGFLSLQRIDWSTSAVTLERLIEYEAVHQIHGWHDLRRRLEVDRRCYAFFSPALPADPLIFIEVALTKGIPDNVQLLLDPKGPLLEPAETDTAVFYSITSCQEGLRGIPFGNFLIKQVAESLQMEFPRIRTLVTLSPVPGFVDWLHSAHFNDASRPLPPGLRLLSEAATSGQDVDVRLCNDLKHELLELCAHYLLHCKQHKAPLDPVARFHLANGARLERLNWMGDTSTVGLRRSLGMTVNYSYRLDDVERNHEAYAKDYQVLASRRLRRLAAVVGGLPARRQLASFTTTKSTIRMPA